MICEFGAHHERRGRHLAVLGQEASVKAGQTQMKQVGPVLEGRGVVAHLAVLILGQDAPREVHGIPKSVQNALYTHPSVHIFMCQWRACCAASRNHSHC